MGKRTLNYLDDTPILVPTGVGATEIDLTAAAFGTAVVPAPTLDAPADVALAAASFAVAVVPPPTLAAPANIALGPAAFGTAVVPAPETSTATDIALNPASFAVAVVPAPTLDAPADVALDPAAFDAAVVPAPTLAAPANIALDPASFAVAVVPSPETILANDIELLPASFAVAVVPAPTLAAPANIQLAPAAFATAVVPLPTTTLPFADTVLLPAPLPITDGPTGLTATFVADATVGVRMQQVDDLTEGGQTILTAFDGTSVRVDWNCALWRIEFDLPDGTTVTTGPENATSFESLQPAAHGGDDAFIFEWRGITIPGAPDGDTIWVRVAFIPSPSDGLAPDTDVFELVPWVGRERGSSAAIMRVFCPFVVAQNFATARGGESNADASARSRVLIPMNLQGAGPAGGWNNYSQGAYAVLGDLSPQANYSLKHPSPVWNCGFVAMASGDDQGNERRSFQIQVRDARGYLKELQFQTLTVGTDVATMLAPAHLLQLSKVFARAKTEVSRDGNPLYPDAPFDNSYQPRWAAQIAAWRPASRIFWQDCIERYRTLYKASATPSRIDLQPLRTTFGSEANIFHLSIVGAQEATAFWMEDFMVPDAAMYKKAFENVNLTSVDRLAHHFQTWIQFSGGSVNHCKADFSDVFPELEPTITALHALSFKVSLYARVNDDSAFQGWQKRILSLYGSEIPVLYDSKGIPRNGFAAHGEDDDLSFFQFYLRPAISFAEHQARFLVLSIRGRFRTDMVYHDAYSGGTLDRGTGNREGGTRYVESFGGDASILGKQRMIDAYETERTTEDLSVMSEVSEEYTDWDWVHAGYDWIAGDFWSLAEESILDELFGTGLTPSRYTDYPIEFRNPQPPIWQNTHNQHHPAQTFLLSPTLEALDTTAAQGGGFGLTADEMEDNLCAAHSLTKSMGHHGWVLDKNYDVDFPLANLDALGDLVSIPGDPTDVGLRVLTFFNQIYSKHADAFAGQFLIRGESQHPMVVVSQDTALNPAVGYAAGNLDPTTVHANWFLFGSWPIPFGNNAFQIPYIWQSVWEHPTDGSVGIVLINWGRSAFDAEWTFDAALYGFPGLVDVEELNLGAGPTPLGSPGTASFTIGTTPSASDIDLGTFSAQTMRCLRVTPV